MSVPAFNFALLPQANGDVVLLAVPPAQIEELAESRHLRRDVGVDCASQPRPRADRRRWLWF